MTYANADLYTVAVGAVDGSANGPLLAGLKFEVVRKSGVGLPAEIPAAAGYARQLSSLVSSSGPDVQCPGQKLDSDDPVLMFEPGAGDDS